MAATSDAAPRLAYSVSELAEQFGKGRDHIKRLINAGAFGPKDQLPRTGPSQRAAFLIPAFRVQEFLRGETKAAS